MPNRSLNSTAWVAYKALGSVNSVSSLILKHRPGLVTDCHRLLIVPIVECCRCIGQALLISVTRFRARFVFFKHVINDSLIIIMMIGSSNSDLTASVIQHSALSRHFMKVLGLCRHRVVISALEGAT